VATTHNDAVRVVLDPAVIIHEVMSPLDRPVLKAWLNGHIVPVISRPILDHTLGFLAGFGIRRELLLTWALWLSHRDKVHIVAAPSSSGTAKEDYVTACKDSDAAGLVTSRPQDFAGVKTLTPESLP
jgi:hypothetical protein